jgi:hypothetical protein
MIQESYQINEQTIALYHARELDYDTVVLEKAATYWVRKTPMQLIKDTCFANWSTYEGKRQAVIHHTNYRKKFRSPSLEKDIFPSEPTPRQTSIATGSFSTISHTFKNNRIIHSLLLTIIYSCHCPYPTTYSRGSI